MRRQTSTHWYGLECKHGEAGLRLCSETMIRWQHPGCETCQNSLRAGRNESIHRGGFTLVGPAIHTMSSINQFEVGQSDFFSLVMIIHKSLFSTTFNDALDCSCNCSDSIHEVGGLGSILSTSCFLHENKYHSNCIFI